jgi:two-component system OmpR family response regulator
MTNFDHVRPTILVVDDNAQMRNMLTIYLEENDIRVLCAAGRGEMSRHLDVSAPDLVLLDLNLGGENGIDLLREIRSDSEVPVIIITGNRHNDVDHEILLALGANDYTTKPFRLSELLMLIRTSLTPRDQRAVPPRSAC